MMRFLMMVLLVWSSSIALALDGGGSLYGVVGGASLEPEDFRSGSAGGEIEFWQPYGGIPYGCNGWVHAMAEADNGDLIIGGSFTVCGDTYVRHVARWNGSEWLSLGTGSENGVDAAVFALAVMDGQIYVGGSFNAAGTVAVRHIARWDGVGWHALGSVANNGVDHFVGTMAVFAGEVFVGGQFQEAGGIVANHVARWNGTSWNTLGTGADNGVSFADGALVQALHAGISGVVVGGSFDRAGQVHTQSLALWNNDGWQSFGGGVAGNSGDLGSVRSLSSLDGDLYVGGHFRYVDGLSANNIARWDGQDWHALIGGDGRNGIEGEVSALESASGVMYVGGVFTNQSGVSVGRNHFLSWDGANFSAPITRRVLGWGVSAIIRAGSYINIGGGFDWCNTDCDNLTRFRFTDSNPLVGLHDGSGRGINGVVNAAANSESSLTIAGEFTRAGVTRAGQVASWHGGRWEATPSGGVQPSWSQIELLSFWGGDLYAAGTFDAIGGALVPTLARWRQGGWEALGDGVPLFRASSIVSDAGGMYVGGHTFAGNSGAWRWDGKKWHSLELDPNDGFPPNLWAMAVDQDVVYAAGSFDYLGVEYVNHIAQWNGKSWSALGTGSAVGVDGWIRAMAVMNGSLYVAGEFKSVAGGTPARNIARWDGSAWHAVGDGSDNGIEGSIAALVVFGNDLYAAGEFDSAGGLPATNIARWDGLSWHALADAYGEGVAGSVRALAVDATGIYVVGDFPLAGGRVSVNVARWRVASESIFADGFELP